MNDKSRILALDVGKKRIGLAVSDELKMFASPLQSLPMAGEKARAISEILNICKEKNISTIVIGKPLSMSGEATDQLVFTEKFAAALQSKLQQESSIMDRGGVELVFIDERLTSVQAEQYLAHSGKKNLERRNAKDQISASILLETYLLSRKRSMG